MQADAPIAFAAERDAPGLEILVNFGVFAGREATSAELDELAKAALAHVDDVSVVSEQRLEVGDGVEAVLHQVRLELDDDVLPAEAAARHELRGRLLELAERWARDCIAERHADVAEI